MAKQKKTGLLQKILIVGAVLIAVQVSLLFYFRSTTRPVDIRQAISQKVQETPGLSERRREQLRLQLAINDFRIQNGKLPAALDELIPKYFDTIPLDPETKKPFAYSLQGDKFILGAERMTQAASAPSPRETIGIETEADQKTALIASLEQPLDQQPYVYDPTGKREPFRPFDFSPVSPAADCAKEPLTCTDIGQLRLAIVVSGVDEPRAIVEDSVGHGYTVKKGTKIGRNNGEIVEILPDRIKILESTVDFTGEAKTNVVEMMLRTKDQSETSGGRKTRK